MADNKCARVNATAERVIHLKMLWTLLRVAVCAARAANTTCPSNATALFMTFSESDCGVDPSVRKHFDGCGRSYMYLPNT